MGHPWPRTANPASCRVAHGFKPAFGQRGLTGRLRSRSRASLRIVECFGSKADQEPRFALWSALDQKRIKSLASHCGVLWIKSGSRASLRIVECFGSKADQEPRFALWSALDQKQVKSLASHCGVLWIKSGSRASLCIVGGFGSKADQEPRFASWGGSFWIVRRWCAGPLVRFCLLPGRCRAGSSWRSARFGWSGFRH
ncbi:hypothetical protein SAMN04490199_3362 [Pseudomonas marginalis]|jgi:hypothetical protein|nr:hypothetical protein SAMN04490199_3362 [Pseudomonas marginalis]